MFDVRIKNVMDRKKLLTTSPETTVAKAAKLMTMKHVGAMLLVEGKTLVGIFTERDALYRVIARGRDPETTRLAEVMTPNPQTVGPEESFGRALMLMYENGFRHLPVIDSGVPVGIVSARHALDPELEEFTAEASRRQHLHAQV